jgi:hypothetical protein
MDIKTLEYMEIRVIRARDLTNKIKVLSETIELLSTSKQLATISLLTKHDGARDLLRRFEGTDSTSDAMNRSELYEAVKPALIDAFTAKLNKLQEELDQI